MRNQPQNGIPRTRPTYLNIRGSYATQAAMMSSHSSIARIRRATPVRKSIWGPYLWRFFHAIGYRLANIPDAKERCDKTKTIWAYTNNLIQLIPCPECRVHALSEYIHTKYKDPDNDNCDWYQIWAHTFHNKVNARLHKPIISVEKSVELSASLDALEQLQGYINSINGWRFPKIDSLMTSIKAVIETF